MITQRTRHWIGSFMLIAILVIVTPSLVAWRLQSVTASMTQRFASPLASVSTHEDLKLSDAQKTQIAQLEREYRDELREQCSRHCSARMKIGTGLQHGQIDEGQLMKQGREAGEAYARAEEITVAHMIRVCDVLNPEQQKILLKKIGDHIAATCPGEFLQ